MCCTSWYEKKKQSQSFLLLLNWTFSVTPFDVVKARLQAQSRSTPDIAGTRLNGMTVIKMLKLQEKIFPYISS